jgi:hypothetical protein
MRGLLTNAGINSYRKISRKTLAHRLAAIGPMEAIFKND